MILQNIPLYSWTSGVVLIAIFAVVCLTLIGVVVNFMMSGKKDESSSSINENEDAEQ